MIGHLGVRISALLDGQLSGEEEERAWAHVHACHTCRDLVEREGWVKTRLAGLSLELAAPPPCSDFKDRLLAGLPPGDVHLALAHAHATRPRRMSLMALGGGAAGAAVMGVLALAPAPADAPVPERRAPIASFSNTAPTAGFGVQGRKTAPLP